MSNEDQIPEKVYWDQKETMFFDDAGKRMGGKFFDKWKDRRDEFPQSRGELGAAADTTVAPPVVRRAIARLRAGRSAAPVAQVGDVVTFAPEGASIVPDEFLEIARHRKQLFDAYVAVGFYRDEALELCVK